MMESDELGERWARVLDPLHEWDPTWTERYTQIAIAPWIDGVLTAKEVQLISVGLSAAITNLDAAALRRNIRAALHAGAKREEILEVLKMAAVLALHSMSLGAPLLIEEAEFCGANHEPIDALETKILRRPI